MDLARVEKKQTDLTLPKGRMAPSKVLETIWASFSDNTREAYRRDFNQFVSFLAKQDVGSLSEQQLLTFLGRVNGDHVALWLASLKKQWSAATVARKIAALKSVLGACVESGLAKKNVALGRRFKVKVPHTFRLSAPSIKQFRTLAGHLAERARNGSKTDKRNMAAFSLLGYAGARSAEVVGATVGQWRSAFNASAGEKVVRIRRKGGKDKSLTVPPKAVRWINLYLQSRPGPLADTDRLIASRSETRLDRRAIYGIVRRSSERCGFRTHPHAFRHFIATRALDRGASLEDVRAQLGHASTATTRIYDDAIRAAKAYTVLDDLME